MAWEHADDPQELLIRLKSLGFKIISLEQSQDSKELMNFDTSNLGKFVLVVGNEVDGVSESILKLSDEIVEISMRGKKESLNVSVSTGIALFQLLK
jgi:tRNA G18 (ribose-2'-O)-methylase SpoU